MDIKTAYLKAPIDKEIFLEQPGGVKQDHGDMVCKLKRLPYGLKQKGRNWYECLSHRLELGFHSSQHDKCLWTQKRGDHHHCWALVWVDDMVYGSTDEDFGGWSSILSDSQSCLALVSKNDGSYKAKHFATRLREQDVSAKTFRQKILEKFWQIFHAGTSRIILVLFLVLYKLVRSNL